MKTTEFTKLLRRKFVKDCLNCDKERKKIAQALSEKEMLRVEFHPDISPHGTVLGWHINLVPKD